MPARHRTRHEREQLELFRALPGDLAPRDAQDLMAYPFFSLAKTHRTTPIDFRMNEIAIRVEAVPEHGMATIWDADVLIWAASQIVEGWFCFAGLWRPMPDGRDAFTLLTTEPGPDVAPIHNRQMVVLERPDWRAWLELSRREAELLRAAPEGSLRVEQVR